MDPDLKEWVKSNSLVAKEEERFSVYELNTTPLREDRDRKIREVSVGPKNEREVKTVLLLGESGAGKTAFLNALLNVVFGVDIDDEVRLKLKEPNPHCHTSLLIYHQEGMPYPFNYRVVDTLGLGDDDDQDDEANQNALKEYLSDQKAISHLNCVALVWKSSSQRLDERSSYILCKINAFMSPEMKPITDVLVTFSLDESPKAIAAVEEMKVEYNKVFFFENAPLYECPSEKRQKIHSFTWESMVESHKKFLKKLNDSQAQDLQNTAHHFSTERKREAVNIEVGKTKARLCEIQMDRSDASNRLGQLNQRLPQLKEKKFADFTRSNCEILLKDGEHCHYCRFCGKFCIASCRSRHIESNRGCCAPFLELCWPPPRCQCSHIEREHVHQEKIFWQYATGEQKKKFVEDQTSHNERIEKMNIETEIRKLETDLKKYDDEEKLVSSRLKELQESILRRQ